MEISDLYLDGFLKELNEIVPDAVILQIVNPYASEKIKSSPSNLPLSLPEKLFNLAHQKYSVDTLRNLKINFTKTKEEQVAVFQNTKNQSRDRNWFKLRAGRITSSNFKSACSTNLEKPSLSLIKMICYPLTVTFHSKFTKYGILNEQKARKAYADSMKVHHQNFRVSEAGFCISTKMSQFGASADGVITCDCCGEGCLEIKCPFRLKKIEGKKFTVQDFVEMKDSCLIRNQDGTYALDSNHLYYYQVQLHMYALEKTFCDFIIWCPDFFYGIRILYNESFMSEKSKLALKFHEYVIKPEMLSRCYTEDYGDAFEIELFCYCSVKRSEEVIECSNKSCEIKLFHLSCTNFLNFNEEGWICDLCLNEETSS